MYDPNKKFSADDAEAALGMEEDDKAFLRMIVTIDLLCAHAGISDEEIRMAYEQKLKGHLLEAAESLQKLAED
jgi:hypothetical protein